MIFIETRLFTKLLPDYLSDDEYRGLQSYLLQKPDVGDIVRGSGGVRKVRWAKLGQGKSGGLRVIYYWKKSDHEIWMLTLYSKSERATIASHVLNLNSSVESQTSAQPLVAPRKLRNTQLTNKVKLVFLSSLCTPMAYTSILRSTDEYRLKQIAEAIDHEKS